MKSKLLLLLLASRLGFQGFAADTAFTYQGRLTDNGSSPTEAYDLKFTLRERAPGVRSWGPLTKVNVNVVAGEFDVMLDFGTDPFKGNSLQLEIEARVHPTSGDPQYVALSPAVPLTPVPYAIAALTIPKGSVTAAHIAPGSITADHLAPNTVVRSINGVTADAISIQGAAGIAISQEGSVIRIQNTAAGSGTGNLVTGDQAAVLSGSNNQASGSHALVAGGGGTFLDVPFGNKATNSFASVLGGMGNAAGGVFSAAIAGFGNSVTGVAAVVAGGSANRAGGEYSTVVGGRDNQALTPYSAIPGGRHAIARSYGQVAHATGLIVRSGDAQESKYIFRGTILTPPDNLDIGREDELFLDGIRERIQVPPGAVWYCRIEGVSVTSDPESNPLLYACFSPAQFLIYRDNDGTHVDRGGGNFDFNGALNGYPNRVTSHINVENFPGASIRLVGSTDGTVRLIVRSLGRGMTAKWVLLLQTVEVIP